MEISLSAVEAEDGYCPECGAVITSSSIITDKDDDFDDLDGEDDSEPVDSVDDIDIEDIEDVDFDEDIEEE
jgi:hypothetical protein